MSNLRLLVCFLISALGYIGGQADHASFDAYTASLTPMGSSGVSGEVTVFVTPGGPILGVGSAKGLPTNRRLLPRRTQVDYCGTCERITANVRKDQYKDKSGPTCICIEPQVTSIGESGFGTHKTLNKVILLYSGTSISFGKDAFKELESGRLTIEKVSGANGQYRTFTRGQDCFHDIRVTETTVGGGGGGGPTTTPPAGGGPTTTPRTGGGSGGGIAVGPTTTITTTTTTPKPAPSGVHVHAGSSCNSPGGHYFDRVHAGPGEDPWAHIAYGTVDENGEAKFKFAVDNGAATALQGKPFVVHDPRGGMVACGILSQMRTVFPATLDSATAIGAGEVTTITTESTIAGAGYLSDLRDGDSSIHVNDGTACTDATAKGEPLKTGNGVDPFTTANYLTARGYFVFDVKSDNTDVENKPFIVKNSGEELCGVLEEKIVPPPSLGQNEETEPRSDITPVGILLQLAAPSLLPSIIIAGLGYARNKALF